MTDPINQHLNKFKQIIYYSDGENTTTYRKVAPLVVCNDGFTMSVQVGRGLYCSPRIDESDYYHEVEVDYPSEREELLMPYVEDETIPTNTVYGYVPIEVVNEVIRKHGGIK